MAKHTKASSFLYIRIVVLRVCVHVQIGKTSIEAEYVSCINTCFWLALNIPLVKYSWPILPNYFIVNNKMMAKQLF